MKFSRRQFLQLSSVVGWVLLFGKPTSVTAAPAIGDDLMFPPDFPIAFSSPTQLDRQSTSTSILSFRSLSFWERLFNLK